MTRVASSVITHITYSRRTRTLTIGFHSGRIYRYDGVSRYLRDRLVNAPSIGRFFGKRVRTCFPTQRVA